MLSAIVIILSAVGAIVLACAQYGFGVIVVITVVVSVILLVCAMHGDYNDTPGHIPCHDEEPEERIYVHTDLNEED